MEIKITQEKRGKVERIQNEFRSKLSPNEILRGTAQGVNSALTRSIPRINKRIKERYNISQKYLSRQAVVSPKANSGSLYGGIKINENRLPVIAFKPKQSGSSISVAIHKGKTTMIRHAFVATMSSGHKGVFSRGRYQKRIGFVPGREKTASGKIRITELMTASPFTMGISPDVRTDVAEFMGNEVTARVHGILTSRVNKIAAKTDDMKRIIQHGNSSKMAIYVRKCPCGCQFEYGAADVDETFFDPRDRVTMWYVECPECGDKTGFEKPDPVRYEQE